MYKKTVEVESAETDSVQSENTELANLQHWAPPILEQDEIYPNYWALKGWVQTPEQDEIYPNYWALKGWRCFKSPA